MSKYIIEIEEKPLYVFDKDTQTYFPRLWRVKGFNSLVFDKEGLSRLEELNSDYINEHYGSLQDDAYQKGFEDGKAQSKRGCEGCRYECENKRRVPCILCSNNFKLPCTISSSKLTSQWTAKGDEGCDGCKYQANRELTCPCSECANNYKNQWTAKDDKFEFGDEIIDSNGAKGCVVSKDNEGYDTMYALFDGCRVPQYITQKKYRKTGKRYDIEKILGEMKGDNDK